MSAKTWVLLVSILLVGALGTLFYVQNSLRLVELSLDLGFSAFKFGRPLPVPALLFGTFGLGLVLGGLLVAMRRRASSNDDLGGLPRSGGSSADPWS